MPLIEDLPDEVLEYVFANLSLQGRKSVRLVNKHWLSLCNSKRLTKNECVVIKLKDLHQLRIPKGCLNLKISDNDTVVDNSLLMDEEILNRRLIDGQQADFWRDHGSSVRSVQIINKKIYSATIYKIISHCLNISKLSLKFTGEENDFDYCFRPRLNFEDFDFYNDIVVNHGDDGEGPTNNSCVLPTLECLSSLTISGKNSTALINGLEFQKLIDSAQNLKRLVLCNISMKDGSYKRKLMKLIAKNSSTLTELVIVKSPMTADKFVGHALKLLGPQLTSLHLVSVPLCSVHRLIKHKNKFSNLQNLALTQISFINSLSGLSCFKNLKFVSFCNTFSGLRDEELTLVLDLEHLEGLDIRNTSCTADGISKCFERKEYPNLVALAMNALTDFTLMMALQNLPNIKFLDFESCCQIGCVGLQAVINNCCQLTHLSLKDCRGFSAIEPISINRLVNLVYLNLDRCYNFESSKIPQLKFKKLRFLNLHAIRMPPNRLTELLENCPKLERVNLVNEYREVAYDPDVLSFGTLRKITIFDFSKNN